MKKPFFHACRGMIILAVMVSLLLAAGIGRVNASGASPNLQSVPAGPYPGSRQADGQPPFTVQADATPPPAEQAEIHRPESDPPPASEIRQNDSKILGQPSMPGEKLEPTPGLPDAKLRPTPDHPEPAAAAGWSTIMSEDFEGSFPTGLWDTYDADDPANEVYWAADDYKPHWGVNSAWAARGGRDGLDPESYYYPSYCNSWMVYGPFDLSDASDAELLFYYWNLSELNYDLFGWYASTDGQMYYGNRVSGDSGGWVYVNFDLTSVPTLGDLTGLSSVWIAFIFTSNGPNLSDGPFVDDIVLQKYSQPVRPNLIPYTPSGWDFPIVPSTITGTTTVSALYTDLDAYIDWAVVNDGVAISATFTTCLYYDGRQAKCWDTSGLNQGYYVFIKDWLLTPTPTTGPHTLKLVTDANNTIAESNESDNTWEYSFNWLGPSKPNLTSYTPDGWDYPIVPSTATGTTIVSTLYTNQTIYIDWAVINNGAALSATFKTCLYYDGTQLRCWDITSGLDQGHYIYVTDWALTLTPTPGAHTLKIVADTNNTITESNESDNTWERSFTWTAPSLPNLAPHTPSGWSFPTVPSQSTGTTTVSTLRANQTTYIDWAIINNGAAATSAAFKTCLYLDTSQVHCWDNTNAVSSGNFINGTDWVLTPAPSPGAHTLKLVADANNTVAESNESDNTWEHSFTWIASSSTSRIHLPLLVKDLPYFAGPWEVEPNDTYLQANGPLLSGRSYTGYPDDDRDYFSINLRNGGNIVLDLGNVTGKGVQLQLFYQTTSNVVGSDLKAPYHIEYTGAAGWYYIYIYTAGNYNTSSAYTLQATYP